MLSNQFDSLCHYNPTVDAVKVDPDRDCGLSARWHVMSVVEGHNEMYQACELHLGPALGMPNVVGYHEFSSTCGLEGTYWATDLNCCMSAYIAYTMGYIWWDIDTFDLPDNVEPEHEGWVRALDTGKWHRWTGSEWTETVAPIGAT